MRLEINKSYLLFTKKETITYKKVKVLGILNYDEIQNVPDSVYQLAINETVVDTNGDTNEYLRKQAYYKLETVEEPKTNMIAWDDIIDFDKTTELNIDFAMASTIRINSNSSVSIDEVKAAIEKGIRDTFNGEVEITNRITNNSTNGSMNSNEVEDKLKDYEKKLEDATLTFDKIAATLNKADSVYIKLERLNTVSNLDEINKRLTDIEAAVESIYEKL